MNNEKKREIAQKAMISMVESKHPAISNETWEGLAIDACEAAEAISNEMDKRWPVFNTSLTPEHCGKPTMRCLNGCACMECNEFFPDEDTPKKL